MVRIQTKAHVGTEGRLDVQLPVEYREKNVDVLIVVEPVDAAVSDKQEERDANGWRIGFLDRMYGIQADDPIERLPQGMAEVREAID